MLPFCDNNRLGRHDRLASSNKGADGPRFANVLLDRQIITGEASLYYIDGDCRYDADDGIAKAGPVETNDVGIMR